MIDEKKLIEKLYRLEKIASNYRPDVAHVCTNLLCEITDFINEQPKVGEWIPFNKKEPKEEGLYLCCFDDGFITTVEYEDGDWNLWADSGEVVAWQPLPEPYKVDA